MNDSFLFNFLSKQLGGRNLYLVGMMGSGKSRTGPVLANQLSYGFVDVDEIIEKASKNSISNIFAEEGEACFRQLESQVLKEIGCRHSLVVATGGGLVTRPENWGILHQGVVIWINPKREVVLKRLESDPNIRPLLQKNLRQDFDNLFQKRETIYREADLHISIDNESPENVAFLVLRGLEKMLNQKEVPNEQQTTE